MLKHLLTALSLSLSLFAAPLIASAQTAGTLVSAEPVVETPGGTQAWRISYWTSDQDGRVQQVTGMVIAPREAMPLSPRRVIAWAHGTWGVAARCAPSLSADFFTATPALADMVARGYVVVAPDYPGLGSTMPHPYLVGGDTARSVLDAVRATRAILGAASGPRFAVWGESQGGHAALWTAIQARAYAPELSLLGTAAAAPPTDLIANFRSGSDANVKAMLTAFTAESWSRRFGAPLSTLAGKSAQGVMTRLARNNCIELGKNPKLGTMLGIVALRRALVNVDMGQVQPWARILRENSVDPRRVPGPVLIAQSANDPVVAPAVTRAFMLAVCRRGIPLRYIALPGGDHGHSARDSSSATLDWFDARFAEAAPPNDCGKL